MIVISNGMLRSGSTLQYNIAASVLETIGPLNRAGFLGDFTTPQTRAKLDAMKIAKGWTIVKTHEPPLEPSFYDDNVRVLFSYRDVRDIAASMKKKWGYSLEQILSDIEAMISVERAFDAIPNVLVQSYDTLYTDLKSATNEVADFLCVAVEKNDVLRIVSELSIERRAEKFSSGGGFVRDWTKLFRRRAYDATTLLHPDHISSTAGAGGDWMNQFSDDEVAALNDQFGGWLIEHSYEPVTARNW